MKAAVCRAFGAPLSIETVGLRAPGPQEVRVRLSACAICHSDILYMDGAWGGTLPAVYGHEATGVVEAIGEGVSGVMPGTPVVVTLLRSCGHCAVCADQAPYLCQTAPNGERAGPLASADGSDLHQAMYTGAFAEAVVVHASQVVGIPDDIPPPSASLLACGVITGVGAVLRTAQVPAGAKMAVVGVGGVGLNCVQGGVLAGAERILAVDLIDTKLATARAFGATDAVNAGSGDVAGTVAEMTGGVGLDYVFIAVGHARAIEDGLGLIRRGGTMVVVGMPPSGAAVQIEAADFVGAGQRILASKMGSTVLARDIPVLVQHYRAGRLKLDELVSGRFRLAEINDAIAASRTGTALRNVVVFD